MLGNREESRRVFVDLFSAYRLTGAKGRVLTETEGNVTS
jgi:hypothetical protein